MGYSRTLAQPTTTRSGFRFWFCSACDITTTARGKAGLVRVFAVVLLWVGVGGLLLGWVLRRLGVIWGALVSFSAGFLIRSGAGVLLAWTAVQAAERGGVGFGVLAAALGLLALGVLVLEGTRVWAALNYGLAED